MLFHCRECNHLVSNAADTCPACGTPHPSIKKTQYLATYVIAFVLVAGAMVWGVRSCSQAFEPPILTAEQAATRQARWADELARQPDRLHLIDRLIDQGVFRRVQFLPEHDPVGGATVWVDAVFYGLSYDQKKTFVDVVYAVAAVRSRRENVIVELRDHHSNHKVGQRTLFGLKLD